ncbi:hypothetical protein CRG98_030820 [Punica granatum]|uniref:Uncharacterized protein n=1 Tax=Punica granatum TaxID=22663 RepID=A0A2I0IXQ1_PUNGR|nr:hypothetical protein CRG98_030820 [Punica granatum]
MGHNLEGRMQSSSGQPASKKTMVQRQFTRLHALLHTVFQMLQEAKLINYESFLPSIRYPTMNPHATCDFHMRTAGHSLDECLKFKHKGQDLIEKRVISITGGKMNIIA